MSVLSAHRRLNLLNNSYNTWRRHQMETFSAVNSPHKGQWRGAFNVFFDLRLNKWLSKQSWGWRFETLSRPLWRHCHEIQTQCLKNPQLLLWRALESGKLHYCYFRAWLDNATLQDSVSWWTLSLQVRWPEYQGWSREPTLGTGNVTQKRVKHLKCFSNWIW